MATKKKAASKLTGGSGNDNKNSDLDGGGGKGARKSNAMIGSKKKK